MTNSKRINQRTIDLVFEVNSKDSYFYILINIVFLQRSDLDGNGKLDFDEFKALIFRSKLKKEQKADSSCYSDSTGSKSTRSGMSTSTSATSNMSTYASISTASSKRSDTSNMRPNRDVENEETIEEDVRENKRPKRKKGKRYFLISI